MKTKGYDIIDDKVSLKNLWDYPSEKVSNRSLQY